MAKAAAPASRFAAASSTARLASARSVSPNLPPASGPDSEEPAVGACVGPALPTGLSLALSPTGISRIGEVAAAAAAAAVDEPGSPLPPSQSPPPPLAGRESATGPVVTGIIVSRLAVGSPTDSPMVAVDCFNFAAADSCSSLIFAATDSCASLTLAILCWTAARLRNAFLSAFRCLVSDFFSCSPPSLN